MFTWKSVVASRFVPLAGASLGLALLTGCAGIPNTLPPEALSQVDRTQVHCYCPQSTVSVQYMRSGYGAGMGLIGAIVDASVTGAMASGAKSRAEQLQEVVADFDFRGAYWNSISNVFEEFPWISLEAVNMQTSHVERVRAEAVASHSLLNLGTDYLISPNMRVFHVNTGLGFYIPGKHKKPSAAVILSYHSSEISEKEGDEALELWMAGQGEPYRRLAAEGIAETARMLRHALNIMGDGDQSAYRPATIRARLVHGRADFGIPVSRVKLKGLVLDQTPERVLFKVHKGGIYSFPLQDVELEIADAG